MTYMSKMGEYICGRVLSQHYQHLRQSKKKDLKVGILRGEGFFHSFAIGSTLIFTVKCRKIYNRPMGSKGYRGGVV